MNVVKRKPTHETVMAQVLDLVLPLELQTALIRLAWASDGQFVTMSRTELAWQCCRSERTAQRLMGRLLELGLISVDRPARGTQAARYRLTLQNGQTREPFDPMVFRVLKGVVPPELRWAVWERDNFICQACGTRRDLSIDHIVPEFSGGLTILENLQTLCLPCNRKKGMKE